MASLIDKLLRFEQPFGTRKENLQEITEGLKEKLDQKLSDLKLDSAKIGKQALVIGGSIAAVYLLLEMILPDDDDEHQKTSNKPVYIERKTESSWLGGAVKSLIITSLLEVARQQLMNYLASQNEPNEEQNTNTTPTE